MNAGETVFIVVEGPQGQVDVSVNQVFLSDAGWRWADGGVGPQLDVDGGAFQGQGGGGGGFPTAGGAVAGGPAGGGSVAAGGGAAGGSVAGGSVAGGSVAGG
ncbi:MAG: hypothetical protein ABTQ32_13410, partial [Myxococcaceae bacterium]